jgi:hypothetical protein
LSVVEDGRREGNKLIKKETNNRERDKNNT